MDENMTPLQIAQTVLKECHKQMHKEVSAEIDALKRNEISTYNTLAKLHEPSRMSRIETELLCVISLMIAQAKNETGGDT